MSALGRLYVVLAFFGLWLALGWVKQRREDARTLRELPKFPDLNAKNRTPTGTR